MAEVPTLRFKLRRSSGMQMTGWKIRSKSAWTSSATLVLADCARVQRPHVLCIIAIGPPKGIEVRDLADFIEFQEEN